MNVSDGIGERAIEQIASLVARALKEELAELAAGLGERTVAESELTVDDVAERLRVSPSTVYAHWREWGGYKLGDGERAAIRFSANALPTRGDTSTRRPRNGSRSDTTPRRTRARRRAVLRGAPRLPLGLGDDA
jgi:hypothetical protein